MKSFSCITLSLLFLLAQTLTLYSAPSLTAEQVIEKHLEAIGGKKAKDITSMAVQGGISMMGQSMDMELYAIYTKPPKVRVTMKIQGMEIVTVVNNNQAWSVNPMMGSNEPQDLPSESIGSITDQANLFGDLLKYKENGHTVTLDGIHDMDGETCYKILLNIKDGESRTLYVDAINYLLIRQDGVTDMMGQQIEVVTKLTDYKSVAGVMIPHRVVTEASGGFVQVFELTSVKINTPIDSSLFERPSK